jgi:hypothetical protein
MLPKLVHLSALIPQLTSFPSYLTSPGDCAANACQWTEGACYPKWYAGILTKPKPLALFKRQVGRAGQAGWQAFPSEDIFQARATLKVMPAAGSNRPSTS